MRSTDARRTARWRKSSASQNDDCVECAFDQEAVLVRDSKNSAGPRLTVAHGGWFAFLASVSRD